MIALPRSSLGGLAAWLLVLLALVTGCRSEGDGQSGAAETTGVTTTRAPPSFRDDTPGLLLIWVKDDGDFQTTTKVGDVPGASRAVVRVILEKQAPASSDTVWVANLNDKRPDGSYLAKDSTRKEWEARGLQQRKARVAAQAPPEPGPGAATATAAGISAIVYGADWCKPCHMAEDYLKKRGAQVTKKDIEEDPGANAEMRQKLKSAGLGGASIPVLDVGGTLLVGFSQSAVDAALRRAGATP